MQSTAKLKQSAKNQNSGKMSQKQLDAIAELKKYYPGLPEDLVINGNLNLSEKDISMLPDNLTINGSLDLRSCCSMEEFPENLVVKGNIYLDSDFDHTYNTTMKVFGQMSEVDTDELPDNFTVGGDLVIDSCSKKLPDNLTVGGSLNLKGSKITELPRGLKVMGNLNCDCLPLKSIPDDLYVGGNLDLFKTQIKNIPASVFIGGGLDIAHTGIRVFPKQLTKVNGCLRMTKVGIKFLPDDLIIEGSFYAEDAALVELPKNLKVGGWMDVSNCVIEELPEGLVVGGGIDLKGCPIESLPENLHVYGHLDLSDTLITALPDGLIVNSNLYINRCDIQKLPLLVNAGTLHLSAVYVNREIIPEGFSITGNLDLTVYSDVKDKEPEPLLLPANMKIGGNLDLEYSFQKRWPKNLYVGGNIEIGRSEISSLPEDLTLNGKVIFTKQITYDTSIICKALLGTSNITYSIVIPKDRYRMATAALIGDMAWLKDRIKTYSETHIEILPLPKEVKQQLEEGLALSTSSGTKRKSSTTTDRVKETAQA
jgi:hypothetical protein